MFLHSESLSYATKLGFLIAKNMGNSSSSRDHILLDEHAADVAEPTATNVTPHLKIYTYAQLKRATGNFNPRNMLRENCLGRVYKGWVDEGTLAPSSKNGVGIPVAVRKSNPGQRLLQWQVYIFFTFPDIL